MKLLIHPNTGKAIEAVKDNLPQVVVFSGNHGLGKKQTVIDLIQQLEPEHTKAIKTGNFERCFIIEPSSNSIGIDIIKNIESLLHLSEEKARYVVINRAEKLTIEAQNAFLKTLEESQHNTHIFLLVDSSKSLLPTVLSRSRVLEFLKPSKHQFTGWLAENNIDDSLATKIYFETSASPRFALEKINSDNENTYLSLAKQLLSNSNQKKMELLIPYEKNKELDLLLEALKIVCRAAMRNLIESKDKLEKINFWKQRLQLIEDLIINHNNHVNTKLIIDKLVLNL